MPALVLDCSVTMSMAFDDAAYLRLALSTGLPLASKDKALNDAAKAAGVALFQGGRTQ